MEAREIKRLALGAVAAVSVALAGLGAPSPMAYASNGGHPGVGHPGVTQGPSLTGVSTGTGHRVTDGVLAPLPISVSDGNTPPPAPIVRDHRNGDNCLSTAEGGVVVTATNPPPPGHGGPGQGGRGGYGGGGGYHPTAPFC
jgi:hypothetical protein